jgi:GNAT superfamily N-acetyltransferase
VLSLYVNTRKKKKIRLTKQKSEGEVWREFSYSDSVMEIRQLNAREARSYVEELADILLDCVAGGASIGFLSSLTKTDAEAFIEKVLTSVERGERMLFAAFMDATLVGTVQLIPAAMENQPHRADVAKLQVHRSARGHGAASALMRRAEEAALAAGRSLLVLDTCEGSDAEKLYLRLGWNKAGVIPKYALFPDGSYCDTVVFWKQLSQD